MEYEDQIDALENEIEHIEKQILSLMEKQYAETHAKDIDVGDKVVFKATDILATVESSSFVAANFHGDRYVRYILVCKTKSGKTYTMQRCEVEKL